MSKRYGFPDGLLEDAVEVGAVTDRSVRVWLRQPGTAHVGGTLAINGQLVAEAQATPSAAGDWTGVLDFRIEQPAPDSHFSIDVAGQTRQGRLSPTPGDRSGLTFGFGSCNRPYTLSKGKIEYLQAAGIYDALASDMERARARFLLLVGDQIYSDELKPISVRADHRTRPGWTPSKEATVAIYRRITRGYLGVPGFMRLRARYPTLTIWDDHDIFDNWGSRMEVSKLDQMMFDAAEQVYNEYQHSRNPGPHRSAAPFHYTVQHGDIGFFVLDIRGMRDWPSGEMLGHEQWEDFTAYLEGPASRDIATLFVVSSVPFAHIARWMTTLFEHMPGDYGDAVRDRWSASAYRHQRDAILEQLLGWQTARPGRQVIILSGDVHVSGAYTIRPRSGPGRIEQFTSSAFSTPLTSSERYMNLFATHANNLFESDWSFTRHFVDYANNAGLVRLTPREQGGHHVEFLVRGWRRRRRQLRTVARRCVAPA